jgi:GNAT superfamily N-acetyltransferase
MTPQIEPAAEADAAELAGLFAAVGADLAARFGPGPWSRDQSERGARRAILDGRVYVLRGAGRIIASVRLQTKKPWAIDPAYFSPARAAIYLVSLAVAPDHQRQGLGHVLMAFAETAARRLGRDAVRLDAFDHPAGAGAFYQRCGYTERGRVTYRDTPLVYFEKLIPP